MARTFGKSQTTFPAEGMVNRLRTAQLATDLLKKLTDEQVLADAARLKINT
jgi:hypothetical protein